MVVVIDCNRRNSFTPARPSEGMESETSVSDESLAADEVRRSADVAGWGDDKSRGRGLCSAVLGGKVSKDMTDRNQECC